MIATHLTQQQQQMPNSITTSAINTPALAVATGNTNSLAAGSIQKTEKHHYCIISLIITNTEYNNTTLYSDKKCECS